MAGINRDSIHQHTASAATGPIAAPVRSRQAGLDRDYFPQSCARFVFGDVQFSVDNEAPLLLGHRRQKSWSGRRDENGFSSQRGQYDARSGGLKEIPARVAHFNPPT